MIPLYWPFFTFVIYFVKYLVAIYGHSYLCLLFKALPVKRVAISDYIQYRQYQCQM